MHLSFVLDKPKQRVYYYVVVLRSTFASVQLQVHSINRKWICICVTFKSYMSFNQK